MKTIILYSLFLIFSTFLMAASSRDIVPQPPYTVPYNYDYVVGLSNGDLQFYRIVQTTAQTRIYSFHYASATHIMSNDSLVYQQNQIQTIPPDQEITIHFHKLYIVTHRQSTVDCQVFDGFNMQQFHFINNDFSAIPLISVYSEIVAEDKLVILTNPFLLLHHLNDEADIDLLHAGASSMTNPVLVYLPETYFVLVDDAQAMQQTETWHLFNTDTGYVSTSTFTGDNFTGHGVMNNAYKVRDRWYIHNPTLVFMDGWLECTLLPDHTLHMFGFGNASIEMGFSRFLSLGSAITLINSPDGMYAQMGSMEVPLGVTTFCHINTNFWDAMPLTPNIITCCTMHNQRVFMRMFWASQYPQTDSVSYPANVTEGASFRIFFNNGYLSLLCNNQILAYYLTLPENNPDDNSIPATAKLAVYPNPFNPCTTISYTMPEKGHVAVNVYNIKGQLVRHLDSGYQPMGKYSLTWDGKNDNGKIGSNGVYFIRMQSDRHVVSQKAILLK